MDDPLHHTILRLGSALSARGLTCATAESCTGGLVGAALTSVAGSSVWFNGGIIAYANSAKTGLLKVREEDLAACGAVSHPVVRQMALGACAALHADLAVSLSGIAGPDGGSPEKPVGTVYLGLAFQGRAESFLYRFDGDRQAVREAALRAAVRLLGEALGLDEVPHIHSRGGCSPPLTPPAGE